MQVIYDGAAPGELQMGALAFSLPALGPLGLTAAG